mmetsp:Transcript_60937/g.170439  ORF Transcript_60937/g.170439 Transcript_60937/m.170439 type:complete len:579 (-) Transcript_60937:137-1873(-)|eukprot:CAMPEP_0117551056 /NCGR_PEP_ID=MMETSP0784-20121206/48994_1 /TAXON_ID=39447 /ORGANISM="" /LENGTH=578 /DNA_ID=CAMNT_0005348083 /DNA_START=40 /DNA_END=1776 /DNA_ORIENTATION=-
MAQSLTVLCTGHSSTKGFVEYIFRVRHEGGCEWNASVRYTDLLDLHERLCAVFGSACIAAFPPRPSVVSSLLGPRKELLQERVAAFQQYFDQLCGRADVVRTACFQATLGIVPPEPVRHLRVRRWHPSEFEQDRATALLEISPDAQEAEVSAIVEAYHVVAKLPPTIDADTGTSSRPLQSPRRIAEFEVSARVAELKGARIEDLPLGAQVELEVSAMNARGRSLPVAIRVLVPQERPQNEAVILASCAAQNGSTATGSECNPATSVKLSREKVELQHELERLSGTLEEREQEVFDLQFDMAAQRVKLDCQRAELERERASREVSPAQSPREIARLRQFEEELEALADAKQRLEDEHRQFEAEQLELRRERADLKRQREEQQEAEAAAERENAERAELLSAQERLLEQTGRDSVPADEQADVVELRADVSAQQARVDEQREELQSLQALEDRKRLQQAGALQRQEEELLARAEQLAKMEADLVRERHELQSSRQKLAVVQAHTMSLLDRAMPASSNLSYKLDTVNSVDKLDEAGRAAGAEPEPDDPEMSKDSQLGDRVWSMDWSSIEAPAALKTPRCSA